MWYETVAKRNANEISSGIYYYLSNLPKNITHVIMYSDCCPGQNKNRIMIAMCLFFFFNRQDNIKTIDHKFMILDDIPDLSRMECDGNMDKIEKALKKLSLAINRPQDWITLFHIASRIHFLLFQ